MADPELIPPDQLYAPPGSFMAGERFLDPGQPPAASKPAAPTVGASTFNPADPNAGLPPGLQQDMAGLKRRQMDERSRTEGVATDQINEDRQRMVHAYNAEGIGPNDLSSFDQDAVKQQHSHSPVEAFGSMGAVFAMVASAFTHQPMTNSLNAGAAALNAIKAGDDKEYDRAFATWKANTDLALKRQAIQHEQYTDSISLSTTDLRNAEAKFKMQAARFGDQPALLMMEKYGLASKEMTDFLENRNKAAISTGQAAAAIEENKGLKLREQAFQSDQRTRSGDPKQEYAAWQQYFGKMEPPVQQAIEAKRAELAAEGKQMTAKDIIQVSHDISRLSGSGTQAERMGNAIASDPDSPFYGKPIEAANEWTRQQTAAKAGAKDFTKAEMAMVETAPSLIKHLKTLDRLADQATGLTTGELQKLAAEYGGINDPAAIYQAALKGARDSLAAWSGGGQTNKVTVEARLDRLPKTYQNAHFNRGVTQGLLQDVTNQTASGVSLMESSGKKKLPDSVRKSLTDSGIFAEHDKGQNPLTQFKENPQGVPDDTLRQLRTNMGAYPIEDQKAIMAEGQRRKAEWDKAHGRQ